MKVAGLYGSPSSLQFEVTNVENISKEIIVTEQVPKMLDNKVLYRLPQPDKEIVTPVTRTVETIEENDRPIIVKESKKVPLLDAKGKQVTYQPMVFDEDAQAQIPSGNPIACFTTEEVDVHKTDSEGNTLYWVEITDDVTTYEPQDDAEITDEDPNWTEDLEVILEDIDVEKTVTLLDSPKSFDYEEVEPSLSTLRKIKIAELNVACNKAILSRFTSNIDGVDYEFSYDQEAQSNFSGAGHAFSRGYTTEIEWTAHKDGEDIRIMLDAQKFDEVAIAGMIHVNSNVTRFRNELIPAVMGAATVSEIISVEW
jgi:hypothetical protein